MEIEVGKPLEQNDIYTGICDVQVLSVNPDAKEIETLNLPVKKDSEPVYKSTSDEGNKKVMIKFYIKNENPKVETNVTFFLENKEQIASSGKPRYINDYGQNSYGTDEQEVLGRVGSNGNKFFKEDGLRVAKIGECELIDFIKNWLCVGQDSKIKFTNFDKLFDGDVSEINKLVKAYGDMRKVQVLLGEKNGYQTVYSKFFGRAGNKNFKYWTKHFENSQGTFNYQNSYALKKWTGIEPDVETSGETKQQFSIFD